MLTGMLWLESVARADRDAALSLKAKLLCPRRWILLVVNTVVCVWGQQGV